MHFPCWLTALHSDGGIPLLSLSAVLQTWGVMEHLRPLHNQDAKKALESGVNCATFHSSLENEK